jgi:hypothetical protein
MRRLCLLLLGVLVLAGCGDDRAERNPISESQAYDRVESYVRSAVTALPADARLEPSAPASSVPCKGQPAGRVIVTTTYAVRGIVGDAEHFDTMLAWWTAHDFEVLDDLRPERHYVWVENTTDGFRMSLRDDDKGELLLGAESPCIRAG